jgi:hypothetical protein
VWRVRSLPLARASGPEPKGANSQRYGNAIHAGMQIPWITDTRCRKDEQSRRRSGFRHQRMPSAMSSTQLPSFLPPMSMLPSCLDLEPSSI